MRKAASIMAALLCLGGCAVSVGTDGGTARLVPHRGSGDCVALFQRFDLVERTMSTPVGFRDSASVVPELQMQADLLRRAGCITMTADLVGLEATPEIARPEAGPAINRVSIHAGVVTNMSDDARALAFFNERGVKARSIGAAGLGRRVYLGPFSTAGDLDYAVKLARAAGFDYPYQGRP